jgi:hypothetical protein
MAVKPIINPIPPGLSDINRANQISYKEVGVKRISNEGKSVNPGRDFTKNYEVVLKDLDTAVMSHIKGVMRTKIRQNGELVQVPIMYANQERWAMARKKGYLRDRNGSIILPLMVFKRSNIDFNDTLPSWKHDLTGDRIQVVRSSKWSKDNQYTNFAIQTGVKPVQENLITSPPQFVNTTYEFTAYTSYIEQMNTIVEDFIQQSGTYWGDNTSYKFLCNVDGSMSDATEMTVGTDRIIKTNFSVTLKGYLLPEVISNIIHNRRFNISKQITKAIINISEKTE